MTKLNPYAAVAQLNQELARLQQLKRDEASAIRTLDQAEAQLAPQVQANPSLGGLLEGMVKAFALGAVESLTRDAYGANIEQERQKALGLLAQAAPAMDQATLNKERELLGLAPVQLPPASQGSGTTTPVQPSTTLPTQTPAQTTVPSSQPAQAASSVPYGQPWHPGPGRLQGADTSHWQSDATFRKSVAGKQFTAIKATEGTNFTDASFRSRWNYLGKQIKAGKMKLRIAYHFMRPGNGVAQAKHFLSSLGIHGHLAKGTRLALDWESSSLKDPKALHDAAGYIHKVTGLWPLIYTSASEVSRAKHAAPSAPLWVAKWGGSIPANVPFVQYADGPGYDHDVFNGNLKALERFAGWIK
jgi:GH25 family lysozyme M1 (1,4-beta-N-acetylmuramidase)